MNLRVGLNTENRADYQKFAELVLKSNLTSPRVEATNIYTNLFTDTDLWAYVKAFQTGFRL